MADNPLIDLSALGTPANTLIEKISDAVGGVFAPYQIVRMAKAEAAATLIKTQSEVQVSEIQQRAMHRLLDEEGKRQANMEAITQVAIPLLANDSRPEDVDADWLTNFFDKSRIVSNTEMQMVWSAVLAGEANAPGAFSRQTVNLLGNMDKGDAEMFSSLCGFMWGIGEMIPLVFELREAIYNNNDIDLGRLLHLQSLGLIEMNSTAGFGRTNSHQEVSVFHFGRRLTLTFPNLDYDLLTGKVLFTRAGRELAQVCEAVPAPGFFEYMVKKWTDTGLHVTEDA